MSSLLTRFFSNRLNYTAQRQLRKLIPTSLLDWYYFHATDVFLISFPKCGRTWLRMMIGKSFAELYGIEDANLLNLRELARNHEAVPTIRVLHENDPHYCRPHEISDDKHKFRKKKVIFLVRDPRDVLVSLYFHQSKREKNREGFSGTIEEFVYQDVGSIDTIVRYYNVWLAQRENSDQFLLIRYEDMKQASARELKRVFAFIGMPEIADETIRTAVEFSAFDKMKAIERQDAMKTSILRPGDENDEESFKTRKGQVGGYKEYLSEQVIQYLNEKLDSLPSELGYK